MAKALLNIFLFIFKIYIRIAIAFWLVPKIFPSNLVEFVLVLYCFFVFGKLVCGGYNRKEEN